MRATLINWLTEVHHQFNLTLETLHLTVAIVDRYFQVNKTIYNKSWNIFYAFIII